MGAQPPDLRLLPALPTCPQPGRGLSWSLVSSAKCSRRENQCPLCGLLSEEGPAPVITKQEEPSRKRPFFPITLPEFVVC